LASAASATVSTLPLPLTADSEKVASRAEDAQKLIALARDCKWHMETDRLAAAHDEGYTVWRLSLLKFDIAPSNKTVRIVFFRFVGAVGFVSYFLF
jgi:hypothetical protein